MQLQSSPTYSHSLASPFLTALQSLKMVLAWVLQCTGSGGEDLKRHLSMYGYLTRAPNRIVMVPYHPCIAGMSKSETAVRPASPDPWGRACNIHSASVVYNRRDGTFCDNIVQEARIDDSREERYRIRSNSELDPMPTELCSSKSLNHGHQGATECQLTFKLRRVILTNFLTF